MIMIIPKLVDKMVVEVDGERYISSRLVTIELRSWIDKIGKGEDKYRQLIVRILESIIIKFDRIVKGATL